MTQLTYNSLWAGAVIQYSHHEINVNIAAKKQAQIIELIDMQSE